MFEQVRNGGGIQERVFTAVGRARYQHTVNRQREQEESKCSSSRDRGRSQSPAVHKEAWRHMVPTVPVLGRWDKRIRNSGSP